MQLTEEAVVASRLRFEDTTAEVRVSERSSLIRGGLDVAVTVCRLDSGAVTDKDDQQQTDPTFEVGAVVLKCFRQHAGPCPDVLESGSLGIVHKILVKISRKAAKAQRRPQSHVK